jgi:hypothetical protein
MFQAGPQPAADEHLGAAMDRRGRILVWAE